MPIFFKNKLFILGLLLILLITTGFRCKLIPQGEKELIEPIELTYWRVWDNEDSFAEILSAYKSLHPNITIKYRKLRYEEYEQALLEAFAEDRGPDIFSIHNTWLGKYKNKIVPLPPEITMAYQVTKGAIKQETITEVRTTPSLSLLELKTYFVDVVYDDVVIHDETGKEQIYSLPLTVDSLALFYNRDLLNNAGIPEPPQFWDQFQEDVKKLTKQDSKGNFIQSGTALGSANNIERYFDILSILMMQNGAQMANNTNRATFNQVPDNKERRATPPGLDALFFYTDFASPAKEVYTWNQLMPNSIDAFTEGRIAFLFGYAYHLPMIKAKAPKLNLGIAQLPQIANSNTKINYANYWTEVVSKKSEHSEVAWDFIQFATDVQQVKKYLTAANKPTALKSIISEQLTDMNLNVFASQVLTSQSWYRGKDANAAEEIFATLIKIILDGNIEDEAVKAINLAARQIDYLENK